MAHLALVGGKPVRQTPFPRWPGWDTAEVEAVTAVVESGRWGADRGTEMRAFEIAGYSLPAYRQPVMLAEHFGLTTPPLFHSIYPNTPGYQQVYRPVTERACAEAAIWLRHDMLLGERGDMDDIVTTLEKIHRYSDELRE